MKRSNKIRLGILIFIWVCYIIWEIKVEKWVASETGAVIRVDLILIIPSLTILTIYILYKLLKSSKTKDEI